MLRLPLIVLALLCGALPARAGPGAALERGTAITDPLALRELDRGRFGIGRVLVPARPADTPMMDDELFALPSMAPVRKSLDQEFERYVAGHESALANETIGVGASFDFQLFDRSALYSPRTRFLLAGIVNRMDRAYLGQERCGEIRLIYRLVRDDTSAIGDLEASPRLPMTLNIVLNSKSDQTRDSNGAAISCAGIARRWLASGDWQLSGAELAGRLMAKDGPLDLVAPENIARIETNIQIAHAPKSAVRDFRTDYLMKVFDYHASSASFAEAPLENQIDRDRLLADDNLKRDFKAWLLEPKNFRELDRGTILIPERFLAKRAIAPTPAGFVPSELQPAFGLVQGEGNNPVFSDNDVVAALQRESEAEGLQNIRSVAGFERRLNDMTCSGCHQTRGIGGFHFPGADWIAAKPSNSSVVPASPHFFGDQVRRRDILISLRDGKGPDYSRGFSSRPQLRGSSELAGSGYEDGWGAHCYVRHAKAAENDRSFSAWTCAEGLACQPSSAATRMGMCFIGSR